MRSRPIVLISAAKGGTRSGSETTSLLHPLLGKSLLQRCVETARGLAPKRIIVAGGPDKGAAEASAGSVFSGVEFLAPAGPRKSPSIPAALRAALSVEKDGDLLVLPADRPLLRPDALRELLTYHRRRRSDLTVMSAAAADPRVRLLVHPRNMGVGAAVVDLKLLEKSGPGAITEKCRQLVEVVRAARGESKAAG